MQYKDELKVLEDSARDTCIAETGRPPIMTDWVDIDKADSVRPNCRSRLVCQETRGRSTIDVEDRTSTFAANSLYEALRMQLSLMMTGPRSEVERDDDVLMPLDFPDSPLARVVHVTIHGTVIKLLKAAYGLRDAGASFDRKVLDAMNLMGVSLGKFSICVGHRKAMNTLVRLVLWGDDFSSSGRRSLCNAVRDDLGKHLMFKTAAVLGPNNPLERTAENCAL